jgi:hypothetical protein
MAAGQGRPRWGTGARQEAEARPPFFFPEQPHMKPILACVPADQEARQRIAAARGLPCEPHQGSAPAPCARCDCIVWVGPRQQAVWKRADAEIVCLECSVPTAFEE